MACWTLQKVTINLKAADEDILLAGLRAAGFTVAQRGGRVYGKNSKGVSYEIFGGNVEVDPGQEHIGNEINRAYSHEVLRRTAKQKGFRIQQDSRNKNKMTLRR